jgi:hypothetical protein
MFVPGVATYRLPRARAGYAMFAPEQAVLQGLAPRLQHFFDAAARAATQYCRESTAASYAVDLRC